MDDRDPTLDEGVDSRGGRKGHGGKVVAAIRSSSDCDLRPGATVCGSLLADHMFAIGGALSVLPGLPSTGEWPGGSGRQDIQDVAEEDFRGRAQVLGGNDLHVLQKYHDMPGMSGLSPYEIVYRRQRPLAGLPYKTAKVSKDAIEFFKGMERMDQRVARKLNEEHERRVALINQGERRSQCMSQRTRSGSRDQPASRRAW